MEGHSEIGLVVFVSFVFAPAIVLWFFALSVWIVNARPQMATWRARAFKCGLILAPSAISVMAVSSAHIFQNQLRTRPDSIWLMVNLLGLLVWLTGLAASMVGKGWGRILLFSSEILTFLADFVVATFIP